ncbi:MAG: hypothetical protein CAF41_008355 [Nitrospira sp. CG24A]|nr:MAG: hypothetical protein CAF41_008355 [Nitrospira sp. CG24A]
MSGFLALAVAIGLVFGAHKLCDLIRAPRWFAKFLFIGAFLSVTYFLAEDIVPESKKPWGIWVALLGAATGIIPVGFIVFKHIDDANDRTAHDSPQHHSEWPRK